MTPFFAARPRRTNPVGFNVVFISLRVHSDAWEDNAMKYEVDWSKILFSCKENVKIHIRPHLETLKEAQPDLGIGAGGDPMKLVDLAAEKAIIEILLENSLSFTLVSEESGIIEFGDAPKQYYVTVDPIDGTNNLIHGLPFYASSIAVSLEPKLSKVFTGLVTDLYHDVTYTAQQGKGAYRGDKKLTPSKTKSLGEAMIGLDLNTYKVKEIAPQLTDLIQATKHIRHFGANALELCYVADGLTDAFVDVRGKLRTTDVAAAFLIIKESGGTITTPEGATVDMRLDPKKKLKFVASGNPQIHKIILSLLNPKKEQKC
jgi:myo-inositol-1(or 4)-monophosphatase